MGEFDRNLAGTAAEWLNSSPSPRTFFTTVFDHDGRLKPISETLSEAKTSGETQRQGPDSAETSHHRLTGGLACEQRSGSRGGLGERIAARAGFSAPKLNTENVRPAGCFVNSAVRSPYLTLSPGFSPTILLESPVFLSNSLGQPSPTTGNFPVVCEGNRGTLFLDVSEKMEDNVFDDIDFTSFEFNPVSRSSSSFLQDTTTKITPSSKAQESFPRIEVSDESKNPLQSQNSEAGPAKDEILVSKGNNSKMLDQRVTVTESGDTELSSVLRGQFDEEENERCDGDKMMPQEDGYSWRKYGQKQVKGCEYPWRYYKCTNMDCQVMKKVECSLKGHATAIIYKGTHNHPKPPRDDHRQSTVDMRSNAAEQSMEMNLAEGNGNADAMTSETVGLDCDGQSVSMQAHFDPIDAPLAISNEEEDDVDSGDGRAARGSNGLGGPDGEAANEPEPKKRKIEASEMIGATRAVREPRIVVQTTSDVDILDDGYRWRKYGQKVVKGNPNPRSYYKCTSIGCNVRKHVERASHDVKSVITTYEGKHNHDVPAPRNAGSTSSAARSGSESSLVDTAFASRFNTRPSPFSPFSVRQQLGLSSGLSFGRSQTGLSNLYMAGFSKLPGLPMNGSPVFMLPNGEPKVEPVSRPSLNVANGSSVYREIMNRLSLGSQM